MLRPFSLLGLALVTSSFMACVVTSSSDNSGGDGGTGATGASGGSGATGGESTTGGAGGSGAAGGAGGAGGGGGAACVDHTGTGTAVSACNAVVGGIVSCGNSAPVAELICERGNTIYTAGAWENLLACLDAIPDDQQSACGANADTLAGNCVDKMYTDACSNPDAATLCNGAKAACDESGDATFDLPGCIEDNNPFGTAGLAEWQTCFDALPDTPCAQAQAQCYEQVSSF